MTMHSQTLARTFNESTLLEEFLLYNTTLLANLHQYLTNRAVDGQAFTILVITYSVLITTGAIGNGLVCLVVACKAQMRTARNVFIINLAVSDLLLCLFTMPFTLTQVLCKVWLLGSFMCKLVSTLQATSIYVSTMSITAIALDRYNAIVYPTHEWTRRLGTVIILAAIWLLASLLSLPLFVYHTLDRHYVGLPQLEYVEFCYEAWPVKHGRAIYSVGAMLFQYVLPIGIICATYSRIYHRLHSRMSTKLRLTSSRQLKDGDALRIRRTNALLASIALIFMLSWLPLNCLNLVTDLNNSLITGQTFRIVFATCHMVGMSSACSNPLLYGWLNDNFRKEFKDVFGHCSQWLCQWCFPVLLNSQDTSPVPLVLYTRQSSVGHDGRVSYAISSNNDMENEVTAVTKVTVSVN